MSPEVERASAGSGTDGGATGAVSQVNVVASWLSAASRSLSIAGVLSEWLIPTFSLNSILELFSLAALAQLALHSDQRWLDQVVGSAESFSHGGTSIAGPWNRHQHGLRRSAVHRADGRPSPGTLPFRTDDNTPTTGSGPRNASGASRRAGQCVGVGKERLRAVRRLLCIPLASA